MSEKKGTGLQLYPCRRMLTSILLIQMVANFFQKADQFPLLGGAQAADELLFVGNQGLVQFRQNG